MHKKEDAFDPTPEHKTEAVPHVLPKEVLSQPNPAKSVPPKPLKKTAEELDAEALKDASEGAIRDALTIVIRRRLEAMTEDVLQAELVRRNPPKS